MLSIWVCDKRSFLGCSEKSEVAKQLLHPSRMQFNFSDIYNSIILYASMKGNTGATSRYYLKNVFEEVAASQSIPISHYNPSEAIRSGKAPFITPGSTFYEIAKEATIGAIGGDRSRDIAMLYFGADLESDEKRREFISVETPKLVTTVNDKLISVRVKDSKVSFLMNEDVELVGIRFDPNAPSKWRHGGIKNYRQVRVTLENLMRL